jgi:endonuclease/exonuclease/phosphatase (EEP) superfamily protein YafD
VIAVGDFGEPAWSGQMKQVAEYSRGTRLRCGGWLGATYSGLGGLFGWSPDHVFMVNGRATSCKIGSGLAGSRHRPLWIGVPAAAATPARSAPSDPQ